MTVISASPAAAAGPGRPCPFSRMVWPSARPAGNLDLDFLAGRQLARGLVAPLAASGSVIVTARATSGRRWLAAEILRLELRAPAAAPAAAPPNMSLQDVVEAAAPKPPPRRGPPRWTPSGPQVKVSKLPSWPKPARGPCAGAAAEALEALEARLALGVDLAAVEGLALVVVAEDFVGGVQLGELATPPSCRACWRRDAASWRACGRRS